MFFGRDFEKSETLPKRRTIIPKISKAENIYEPIDFFGGSPGNWFFFCGIGVCGASGGVFFDIAHIIHKNTRFSSVFELI
jgi:hypothetical protein